MSTQPNEQTPILPHNYYPPEYAMFFAHAQIESHTNAKTLLLCRSDFTWTWYDVIKNQANRFIYSRFHIILYLILALLSLVSVILSLEEVCPSRSLIILEYSINSAMVLEVLLRVLANGRAFFHSFYSAIDAILLLLCIATLVLITTGCSNTQRDEAIIDTILLTIRNTVQLCRFAAMIQRNKRTLDSRAAKVDFTGLNHQPSQSSLAPSQFAADSEDDDGVLV